MKKRTSTVSPSSVIEHQAEWQAPNGQKLISGQTEITVPRMGRVIFHGHSRNTRSGAEWLDVWQPPRGQRAGQWRSVLPDTIKTVHRPRKEA